MRLKNLLILSIIGLSVLLPVAAFAEEPIPIISKQTIDIYYTYDLLGRLIGQRQTIHGEGTDIDGWHYITDSAVEYTIIAGTAKMSSSTTTTNKDKADGSTQATTTTVNYTYDIRGRLTGASGTRTVSGYSAEYEDEDGNFKAAEKYSGSFDLTYKIISGQAMVASETGSTTYDAYNEETGQYEENKTETTTTTYEYRMIAGSVRVTSTTTDNNIVYVDTDTDGQNLWEQATITTTYEYDPEGGFLADQNGDGYAVLGKGTGSGYLLNDGYQTYTSTITVEYEIINGMARQTHYNEDKVFDSPESPSNVVDPAVQGTIEGAYYVASKPNNVGQCNYYVYIVVAASAYDDTMGDGTYEELDGEYYLVRISVGRSESAARSLVSKYSGKQGQTMTFYGNTRPGRIIEFLGEGSGGFDIP